MARTVFCKKLKKDAPGIPFKPFPDELGQEIFDNVSMEAWQMWLQESPRYINTAGWDLQSPEGREQMRKLMRVYFELEEGDLPQTAWVPPDQT